MISEFAWVIPAVMFASGAIIVFFGKQFPKQGAEVGITAVALALVMSVFVAVEVFSANVDAVAQVEAAHEGESAAGGDHAALDGQRLAIATGDLSVLAAEGADAVEVPAGVEPFLVERGFQLTAFAGEAGFDAGIRIDGLAALMFLLVTFVSLMVHIYSTGYLDGDPRRHHGHRRGVPDRAALPGLPGLPDGPYRHRGHRRDHAADGRAAGNRPG